MTMNADKLSPALEQRLGLHATDPLRVHKSKQNHFTLSFTQDNLPNMAAAICAVGHAIANVGACKVDERLMVLSGKGTMYRLYLRIRPWK